MRAAVCLNADHEQRRGCFGCIHISPFASACESSARHLTFTISRAGELTCLMGTCRFQLLRRNLWVLPSTNTPHGPVLAAFLFVALANHVGPFAVKA